MQKKGKQKLNKTSGGSFTSTIREDTLQAIEGLAQEHVLSGSSEQKRKTFNRYWAACMAKMSSLTERWMDAAFNEAPRKCSDIQSWIVSFLLINVREQLYGCGKKHIACVVIERVSKTTSDRTIWDADYGDYGLAVEHFKREFESATNKRIETAFRRDCPRSKTDYAQPRRDQPINVQNVHGEFGLGDREVAYLVRRIYRQLLRTFRRRRSGLSPDTPELQSMYSELDSYGVPREWSIPYLEGKEKNRSSSGAAMDIIQKLFPEHSPATLGRYKSGRPTKHNAPQDPDDDVRIVPGNYQFP